ncbi:MAG: nucleotidyltransferase family protein [Oscillospiraceae bacterium]|nr:nucleotidyltransferase family protein [Oscillospiraceae bacterium]
MKKGLNENMNEAYNIDEIKKISVPIAKKYGVKKLALFGSYARGEQRTASDIDFLIEKGEIQDLFALCGFINMLEDNLGVRVDVLTYEALKNSMIPDAMKDEVVLYEQ